MDGPGHIYHMDCCICHPSPVSTYVVWKQQNLGESFLFTYQFLIDSFVLSRKRCLLAFKEVCQTTVHHCVWNADFDKDY